MIFSDALCIRATGVSFGRCLGGGVHKFRKIILVAVVLLTSGCRGVHRFLGGQDNKPGPTAVADSYAVTGVTVSDYQIIQPIRCGDSSIRVWVKKPGAADYRELNVFEFKAHTEGVGGGGVEFKKECAADFDSNGNLIYLFVTGKPVAPTGTSYKIQSVLNSNS